MSALSTLSLRLLGWPEMHWRTGQGEHPVALPGNKPQALLYYLAWKQQPVARERLMALLWPEAPAAKARASLRNALYQLQRHLPPQALEVGRQAVALSGRYRWEVDLHQVLTLLQPPLTPDKVRQIMALYRGDFLEGFHVPRAAEFTHWVTSVSQWLRTQVLDACDAALQEALRYGQWPLAEDILRFIVRLEPWREDYHAGLIRVLMWQGKYTAALKQYQQCCRILAQELHVEPDPETRALEAEVRRRRQHPPPFAVPQPLFPIVGREEELAALAERLHQHRLVTLVGPSGAGKTALALAFAQRHRHRYAHGVFFFAADTLHDAAGLALRLARALHLVGETEQIALAAVLRALQTREVLLLVDDLRGDSEIIPWLEALRRTAPRVHLVVTAAAPLGLRHESVYAVPPLAVPPDAQQQPPQAYPAGQMLLTLWERFVPRPLPQAEEHPAVAALCRLLGGNPLALELAAMQLQQLSLAELLHVLQRDLDVLQAPWPQTPARHRSLRALFEHLWRTVPPGLQEALRALSVFAGPFDLAAAQAVAGVSARDLAALQSRGLLRPVLTWPQGRTLHRVARHYLQQPLQRTQQEHPLAARHARHYLEGLARRGVAPPGSKAEHLAWQHQLPNIHAAWRWAVRHNRWDLLARAVRGFHAVHEALGRYAEAMDAFQHALARLQAQAAPRPLAARLQGHLAALAFRRGEVEQARQWAQQALQNLPPDGQDALMARNVLGVALLHTGDFAASIEHLQAAVQQARALGLTHEAIKGLINLSSAYLRTGQYQAVAPLLEQGLRLCRAHGDTLGEGFFLLHLGTLAMLQGQPQQAAAHLEQALTIGRTTEVVHIQLHALLGLATLQALAAADPARLAHLADEAVALARQAGDAVAEARALGWRAWAAQQQGHPADAWRALRQAWETLEPQPTWPTRLHLMAVAAHMWAAQGEPARAAALAQYVAAHPATEAPTRARVQAWLRAHGQPLPDQLPPQPPPIFPA